MDPRELLDFVIDKADDIKAVDITTLDLTDKSSITDYMVVCSGTSKRHVQSIANNVALEAKAQGIEIIGTEGQQEGEWVLLDLGDVVLHVMQESAREFYQLEKLWS
ncbi:Ribosomal silencing factor RsfS [Pseudoalteromonas sp. P1-9]|uniref:ribosome silencing factor n=1 Tax=Pseudoalteromonas sp. P1-9 TaxID=1710354 RepID=UPI0006D631AC|nr:ribosome silencing factor [Pseudoalteromonas sp. P1-9]KPV97756.1 Ribosomal silencing factor RsfS [Pseudoalteromonas sp. P1-9]